jgi:hypothetical protein
MNLFFCINFYDVWNFLENWMEFLSGLAVRHVETNGIGIGIHDKSRHVR